MSTILIVDDSRPIRDFCRRELEKEGHRVLTAEGGEEALVACHSASPDLVVLDVQMPGLDGLATAGRMARERLNIPVIFFTSDGDSLRRDLSRWLAVACIEKSEDLTELKNAIAGVLARKSAESPGGEDSRRSAGSES